MLKNLLLALLSFMLVGCSSLEMFTLENRVDNQQDDIRILKFKVDSLSKVVKRLPKTPYDF
jgi:hypothetical protein